MANLDETRRRFLAHFSAIGLGSTLGDYVIAYTLPD